MADKSDEDVYRLLQHTKEPRIAGSAVSVKISREGAKFFLIIEDFTLTLLGLGVYKFGIPPHAIPFHKRIYELWPCARHFVCVCFGGFFSRKQINPKLR